MKSKIKRTKDRSDKTRTRSYSNSSNNSKLSIDEHRALGDFAMKMIDEEIEESSENSEKVRTLRDDFASKGESRSDVSIEEEDFYT